MKPGDAHCVFNGQSRCLKFYVVTSDGGDLRHTFDCHDVGVNDQDISAGEDEYGHRCKCPPGIGYILGSPQYLNPAEAAYGYYFTPIYDDAGGDMAAHGRDGIGVHGGGSDLSDPFAAIQGWEYTYGCLRLQNEDNAQFADSVRYIHDHGGTVYLDVVWP